MTDLIERAKGTHQTTKAIRPIRVEGGVAYVPLTRGYEAVIDAEDVNIVSGVLWHVTPGRRTAYAFGRVKIDGVLVRTSIHRLIASPSDGFVVDHIDGNGLNNRRSNLRLATISQNAHNTTMERANNSSGVKGVYWHKKCAKWYARISKDSKRISLGFFDNIEDASACYLNAVKEFHGEFGRTA